eukprot:TRINITY_DN4878_c0_g1_i2.p1 TRINITY_DN4878_c0_g1~~TRINITY_DN4878_c0_g1_i2.p1  ORF type:complete len:454 (-),score=96.86 TRINITY_DN4878_c0_g1_i2:429-1790(-)
MSTELLDHKYEISGYLGDGEFGEVRIATDTTTGISFACKIIQIDCMWRKHMMEHVKKEINSLRSINHPHVVGLQEVFYSQCGHNLFLILELCGGGDLYDLLVPAPGSQNVGGPLSEGLARRYFQQMISGIAHCHGHGISHRDIKPENLLLDEHGGLKISDFGLSTFTAKAPTSTKCGTSQYLAPEVTISKPYDPKKADIWSCGVLLYVLITACLPFEHENEAELYKMIRSGRFEWPENVCVSPGAKDLVSRLLQPDPEQRCSTAEIKEHPWFMVDLDEQLFDEALYTAPEPPPSPVVKDPTESGPPTLPVNAFELLFHIGSMNFEGLCDSHHHKEATRQFLSSSDPKLLSQAICEYSNSHGFIGCRGELSLCLAGKLHGAPVQFQVEVMQIAPDLLLVQMVQTGGCERSFQEFFRGLYSVIGPEHVRDYKKSRRSLTPNRTHFASPPAGVVVS